MDTGPIEYYQVTLFYQIANCRFEAIGDNPYILRYSRLTGIVEHI
ncbi:MAG TPA: hypothetical protein VJU02_04850 [Nitrospiraceae bacterium]|nr:hypothetical protein [Nitrospiraceae bacterium]